MKKLLAIIIFVCAMGRPSYPYGIETAGFSSGGESHTIVSLLDTRITGNYFYTIQANFNLSNVDYGLESFVVRDLEYDDGYTNISFAPLKAQTFGYGLVLSDLTTSRSNSALFSNTDNAFYYSSDQDYFSIAGFGTSSHLYGININNIDLFMLNLSLYTVNDTKVMESSLYGRSVVGGTVALPLNDYVGLFADVAGSSNGGQGTMAGAYVSYDIIVASANLNVGTVTFNEKFIPGYYTTGYDINRINMVSFEASDKTRTGSFISSSISVIGVMDVNFTNEFYEDGGTANSAAIEISPVNKLTFSAWVKELAFNDVRPVKGKDSNIVGGHVVYGLSDNIYISGEYRRSVDVNVLVPYGTTYCRLGYSF